MNEKILILAPHTDDGELGCGGTIARFLEEDKEIYYVAFSTCRTSVPKGMPPDVLEKELLAAMDSFGIARDHVIILDYPVREFPAHRQKILDDMIRFRKQICPSIVFAPSIHDIHQDHHVIAEEAMRAFKAITSFGYEEPWNNYSFQNQAFFALEERHVAKKIQALACYESQRNRAYVDSEFIRGQARVHGVQIDSDYAEVFEMNRWILRLNDETLN